MPAQAEAAAKAMHRKYELRCSNLPIKPRWALVRTAQQLKSAISHYAADRAISELAVIAWEEC